jgi:pimeloyl-ACP methyl ester carboxylesterase
VARRLGRAVWLTATAALLVSCTAAPTSETSPPVTAAPVAGASDAGPVDIGGREIYLDCRGPSAAGAPTIILLSGYHDSSDVWNQTDVLGLVGDATGPPVMNALARNHRVCAYDRPGTLRYVEGLPLTDRSTPVQQPRTAADIVAELHQTLAAAEVPEPYLLVGHSLGGLMVRLYGQTYPDQIAGMVFVDAFSPTVPATFGDKWPIYRDQFLNPPADQYPIPSLQSPESEVVDLDVSSEQVLTGPALPDVPLVVLTKTESFAGLTSVPGLPAEETNALYEQAQDDFVALAPGIPQLIATGSDHYIQFSQPDLVVAATELVLVRGQS